MPWLRADEKLAGVDDFPPPRLQAVRLNVENGS
jgi:hypothetical protein